MATDDSDGIRIGQHLLRFEPPDVIYLINRGDLTPEEMRAIFEEVRRIAAGAGPLVWLSDVRELGELSSEVRKVAAREGGVMQLLHGIGVIGATFAQRIVITMMTNAARLFATKAAPPPVCFFDTADDARAWAAEQRRGRG